MQQQAYMIIPPLPANEEARLAELDAYDILDTLPEETYDAITYLASQICDAPIALISLVDRDRQWFKSRVGLDATESPRDIAFCAHAILEPDDLLIVPDATADSRFSMNPFVRYDPAIRFYAGAPLVTRTGNALGTLCVIDRRTRTLTPQQEEALKALSVQVMALLELRWAVDELRDKQSELEQAMEQRETFIATVSHEIRTPLTAVVGYIGLLADTTVDLADGERTEMLRTVARQAGDVSNLIEDLLISAKAESGSLQVQCVDVNLEAQVAQVLEGLDQDKAAVVDVDAAPCRAHGDPARVRQIVRNLLTNAFRYGGDSIEVRIRRVGDRAHLAVSDDGPGIPVQDRERVFEAFGQSSNARNVSGSIGLGLPISRLLTEKMGGHLTYERRNERSIFLLDLPCAPAGSPALEPADVAVA